MGNGTDEDPRPGSEHAIDGERFAFEMHLVNLNLDENTKDLFAAAVIGVLFKVDDTLTENSFAD